MVYGRRCAWVVHSIHVGTSTRSVLRKYRGVSTLRPTGRCAPPAGASRVGCANILDPLFKRREFARDDVPKYSRVYAKIFVAEHISEIGYFPPFDGGILVS